MRRPILLHPVVLSSAAVAAVLPAVLPSTSLATEIVIFAIAAAGCSLLLGYGGLLSFGQGIFFGAGSYASALVMIHFGFGSLLALVVAMATGVALALVVGSLAIRRRGIYFVMLTLAFSQMFFFIAYAMSDITGGENGLLGVPRPPLAVFGLELASLDSPMAFYAFCVVCFVLALALLQRAVTSPFGATLMAIRENEDRAVALGYNTKAFKLIALLLSGLVTGLAGGLYAMFLNFVPLGSIEVSMSERILIITILGGTGSFFGSLLGAGAFVLLADLLSAVWPRWLLVLGLILIGLVLCLRGGLWAGGEKLVAFARERLLAKGEPRAAR